MGYYSEVMISVTKKGYEKIKKDQEKFQFIKKFSNNINKEFEKKEEEEFEYYKSFSLSN